MWALWFVIAFVGFIGVLAFDLGRRRTSKDPDGSKHRLSYAVFVTLMILLIGGLVTIRADEANAATVCRGPVVERNESGGGTIWIRLEVKRWCGYTTSSGSWRFDNFTPPGFSRTYGESVAWSFNKWFPTQTQTGVGTAPNGTQNVQYKAYWVAGEFKYNTPPFQHSYPIGARIWAWANGNYTLRETSVVPFTPIPRP